MKQRQYLGYSALIATTLLWGSTFSVTKAALAQAPPLYFLAWRFSIAGLGLLVLNLGKFKTISRAEAIGGLISGASMAVGYIAQTMGMVYSTAAKAGFITGLAVVLVPVLGALLFRRRPFFAFYAFVALATVGLALLSLDFEKGFSLNRGDLLLFVCALAFAVNILNLGRYAPRCRVLMLTLVQVVVTALVCWPAALLLETPVVFGGSVWLGLLYLALLGTILTTAGQTWGQKTVSPERAALVFTLEPVFAAFFAFFLLGETLPPQGLVGGLLIMAGIIGAELTSRQVKSAKME